MATINKIQGYLLALSAVNIGCNNVCTFRFHEIESIKSDLEETFKQHFSIGTFTDYVAHETIDNVFGELSNDLREWFYQEEILNHSSTMDERDDNRVEAFILLLDEFVNGQTLKAYRIQDKGTSAVLTDYYVFQIGDKFYSFECEYND